MLDDFLLFFKLFAFAFYAQWLLGVLGNNKFLFAIALLIGGYYIFFENWTVFSILFFVLLVILMGGVGMFMQDIAFQYDMASRLEHEAEMAQAAMQESMMSRMYMRRR